MTSKNKMKNEKQVGIANLEGNLGSTPLDEEKTRDGRRGLGEMEETGKMEKTTRAPAPDGSESADESGNGESEARETSARGAFSWDRALRTQANAEARRRRAVKSILAEKPSTPESAFPFLERYRTYRMCNPPRRFNCLRRKRKED